MQAVWGTLHVTQGALDTLVGVLREKLDGASTGFIQTERGAGYALLRHPLRPSAEPASHD